MFFYDRVDRARRPKLEVYWADVEGGGATLIVTPAGESILIDSGNPAGPKDSERAGGSDARRIFEVADKTAHLKQIDFLVTTHYHIDHFGGAAEIAGMLPIKSVYDNGVFDGQTEKPSDKYRLFSAEKRSVINPGDELPLKQADGAPKLSIKCIATRQKFIDAPKDAIACPDCAGAKRKGEDKSDNANSVVLLISYGDFSALRRRRSDLEHRRKTGLPGEYCRDRRRLPGDASRPRRQQQPGVVEDAEADGGDHVQWHDKGRIE